MSARATRRVVLLGGSALGALPLSAEASRSTSTYPDAALIELAREFVEKDPEQDRLAALATALPLHSAERKILGDQSDAIGDRLLDITTEAISFRATTVEGLRAKADILRTCLPFVTPGLDDADKWFDVVDRVAYDQHALAWSLVRDLLEVQA